MQRPHRRTSFGELSYAELAHRLQEAPLVLLPVGATIASGPHLPVQASTLTARALAARAADALDAEGRSALCLPELPYTVCEAGLGFPGTLTLRSESLVGVVCDLAEGIAREGARGLLLVTVFRGDSHLAALRTAAEAATRRCELPVVLAEPRSERWAALIGTELAQGAGHAGRHDTALAMAVAPALVRHQVRRGLAPVAATYHEARRGGRHSILEAGGAQAYLGDPASASAEEGELLLGALVGLVVDTARELLTRGGA